MEIKTLSSATFPFRVGCVDTGSNAIRFLAAEFTGPSEFQPLAYERVPVRLGHQVFLTGKLAPAAMKGAVAAFISFRDQMVDLELGTFRAVATGGNIEALATLVGAPRDAVGVARVPAADLRSVIDLLSRLSYHERIAQLGLREDRADVILPAAMVYHHLARLAGTDEVIVPGVGVKEGILFDLVDDLISHTTHEVRKEQQLTKAAISFGRRFMFDEAHGLHVARLALSIFDQLQELHKLGTEDRRLLLAAAILHDIGAFVGQKKHHKHSLYIISHSELPGLSPNAMLMVGNIARYHRKNIPLDRHPDFMLLSKGERERTTLLSSILRVADALDRGHQQHIDSVEVEVSKENISLLLEGEGDLLLERWAVSRKSFLFSKSFQRAVSISV